VRTHRLPLAWIPAFAGMTGLGVDPSGSRFFTVDPWARVKNLLAMRPELVGGKQILNGGRGRRPKTSSAVRHRARHPPGMRSAEGRAGSSSPSIGKPMLSPSSTLNNPDVSYWRFHFGPGRSVGHMTRISGK